MKKTDKISLLMIIVLIFILAGGCDKNDTKMPYSCDPHAVCDNISKNEWTYLGLGDKSITSVAVHPCNPQVIFAGSKDGKIFRSVDCGTTWDLIYDEGGGVREIIVDPQNPYIIYANSSSREVIRSKDGGNTWISIKEGINFYAFASLRTIDIDRDKPYRLYAGTVGFGSGRLFYTNNKGDLWKPVPYCQENGHENCDNCDNDNRLLHSDVVSLAVYPADPRIIYAGVAISGDILKSSDRGENWRKIDLPYRGISSLAFSKDNNYIYVYLWRSLQEYGLIKGEVGSENFIDISIPDSIMKYIKVETDIMVIDDDDNLILRTRNGIYKYNGTEWIDYNNNLPHGDARALYLTNQNNVYTGLEAKTKGGVYVRSID